MKIPQLHGKHKIRDTKICRLWAQDLLTAEDIAERFKLSPRRIGQIVYTNRDFLKLDIQHEKNKRVHNLKRWMEKAPDPKQDKLALQQEIRREAEGADPSVLIDNSKQYVQIYRPEKYEKTEVKKREKMCL